VRKHYPHETVVCHSIRKEERMFADVLKCKINAINESLHLLLDSYCKLIKIGSHRVVLFNHRVIPTVDKASMCNMTCTDTFGYDETDTSKTLSYCTLKDIDELCKIINFEPKEV